MVLSEPDSAPEQRLERRSDIGRGADIEIEVVYALRELQQRITLTIRQGTTARDVLLQAVEEGLLRLNEDDARQAPQDLPVGVYGLQVDDNHVLKAGDRLEVYRPLVQDPKERRRQQARQAQSRRSR